MARERLVSGSGQGLTWGNAFSASTLNGLGANKSILSDIAIDNSVALDLYADVCINFSTSQNWSVNGFAWLFLLPLNQDGTSYGDGRFTAAATGQPFRQYFAAPFQFGTGTQTQIAIVTNILLPPGQFKFCMLNGYSLNQGSGNVSFPSSNCNCYYRTYNRSVA